MAERQSNFEFESFFKSKGSQKETNEQWFYNFIKTYEKTLLFIITLIVTATVSFCLGVEKGRRTAKTKDILDYKLVLSAPKTSITKIPTKTERQPEETQIKPLKPVESPSILINGQPKKELPKTEIKQPLQPLQKPLQPLQKQMPEKEEPSGYVIQLVSYKNEKFAKKEAELLKQKGYSPIIINKGEYIVLCVGTFKEKEKAKSLLSELRKKYSDCYIRRL